jgi:pimeloyl-ACP methyl ester carboxylesterase
VARAGDHRRDRQAVRQRRQVVLELAGAADSRYTLQLMPALRESTVPKLLVWGDADEFQPIAYAERFTSEVPNCELVRVAGAGHIPMENDAQLVGDALGRFFAAP